MDNAKQHNVPTVARSTSAGLPNEITQQVASTLLKLGMSGPRRPVDDLIDRLERPDSAAWLLAVLSNGPMKGIGSPVELLAQGKATTAQLDTIKEKSKACLRGAPDSDSRLSGIAGYFLSIAAGLRHHGKLIGGREREELNTVLLDLASVAPEPFAKLLSEAAFIKSKPG